jgi:putative isomerase
MLDTTKFNTYIPFPSAPVDDPEFSKGYWRGPVWLDQVYFAITALNHYGYTTEANQLTLQVFDRLEGLKEQAPIRENYWPLTGKGMRVNHFSWSAAHLLLLYQQQ